MSEHQARTDQHTPANAHPRIRPDRWLVTGGIGVILLAGSYLLAVRSRLGQATENAILRGADVEDPAFHETASHDLGQITVVTLGIAVLVVAVIGLLRRRPGLAAAGVGVIVAGQLVAQPLKRFVLDRPDLVQADEKILGNSFPSGHTTIAMTVLFAVLIVTPYRWRGLAMVVTTLYTLAIGAETLAAKWHRLSDTIGADGIALICASAAAWWLTERGAVTRHTGRGGILRTVLVCVLAIAALAATALGLALLFDAVSSDDPQHFDTDLLDAAYLGGQALALAGSVLALLVFWGAWHRLEVPPADDRNHHAHR